MKGWAGRTPVLVGVGARVQREEDPERALEPIALLEAAVRDAADDAGSPELLRGAGAVMIPRGLWPYADPASWLAQRIGAPGARSVVAEIGVLQTTPLAEAATRIAAGAADVVVVGGCEARHRARRAERTGRSAPLSEAPGAADEVWRPAEPILSEREITLGLARPVTQYAMLESALRAAEGRSLEADRDDVARLWTGMSAAAESNPLAWRRERVSAEAVRDASAKNPMLAFPYTRAHCSSWNVDQAAGLVLCSLERARSLGIPEERYVFPLAIAESNHMRVLPERPHLDRCHGFEAAGEAVLEHAEVGVEDVAHLELYSCFPVAVRLQQRALRIDPARPVTLTGGMGFAGGPLNSFVLQALVSLARRLRAEPGSRGLLTAISGIVTKQGVSLWSSEPSTPFAHVDVSAETARRQGPALPFGAPPGSDGRVAACTVLYEGAAPRRVALLCDHADGFRSLTVVDDVGLAERATREELCGQRIPAAVLA